MGSTGVCVRVYLIVCDLQTSQQGALGHSWVIVPQGKCALKLRVTCVTFKDSARNSQ